MEESQEETQGRCSSNSTRGPSGQGAKRVPGKVS